MAQPQRRKKLIQNDLALGQTSWSIYQITRDSLKYFFNSKVPRYFGPLHVASVDRFLLTVESRDLSQADKILISVSSLPKLSDG